MIAEDKRLLVILGCVTALLMVPLVAMQFDSGVNWTGFDFLVMGILLYGSGLGVELVLRSVKRTGSRVWIIAGIIGLMLLIWVHLAVGIGDLPLGGS